MYGVSKRNSSTLVRHNKTVSLHSNQVERLIPSIPSKNSNIELLQDSKGTAYVPFYILILERLMGADFLKKKVILFSI